MSGIAGTVSWPMLGLYHASEWALEGMTDALAQEVARFGIHVTQPRPFRTDGRGSSAVQAGSSPAYAGFTQALSAGAAPGDPAATAL
ncbi:SDR family NAD(P)-dependent oxidoreductase [Streptomyces sp. TE33382]